MAVVSFTMVTLASALQAQATVTGGFPMTDKPPAIPSGSSSMPTSTPSTVPGADGSAALSSETRVPILLGTAIGFTILATLIVCVRLYTRYVVVHSPGADDYTIIAALVLSFGVTATTIVQAENGLGLHVWEVPSQEASITQAKAFLAGELLYNSSQMMTKISFLLQYRRIFSDAMTQCVCIVLIVLLAAWGFTQTFIVSFACMPISVISPDMLDKCISSLIVWHLTSVMSIVTDFVIFLVPIPAVHRLNLPLRQKILVMSIFCLGFFTCIISIVRLFTLRDALDGTDTTWVNAPTAWWTNIELSCGIVCSSIATLRPLLRHLLPGRSSARNGRSGSSGYERQSTPRLGENAGYVENGSSGFSGGGIKRSQTFVLTRLSANESQSGLKTEGTDTSPESVSSYELSERRV